MIKVSITTTRSFLKRTLYFLTLQTENGKRLRIFAVVEVITSSLTDSCIVFTLKMESVSQNTIFGHNDGGKWSRKICFEIPSCGIFITEFAILDTL